MINNYLKRQSLANVHQLSDFPQQSNFHELEMYKVVLTVMMLVYQLVNIPQAMDVQAFELHFRIDLYPKKRKNQISEIH